jgi:hypothetical protein
MGGVKAPAPGRDTSSRLAATERARMSPMVVLQVLLSLSKEDFVFGGGGGGKIALPLSLRGIIRVL